MRRWAEDGRSANFQAEFAGNNTSSNYYAGTESIENLADEDSWFCEVQYRSTNHCQINSRYSQMSCPAVVAHIDYTGSSNAVNRFRQALPE